MRWTAFHFLLVVVIGYVGPLSAVALGNQTVLSGHRHSLLTRRSRALVFPPKAAVLITAAMTKIIVGGRPGGLQYSLEFDMYMSLPDSVDGWRPNVLRNHGNHRNQTLLKPKLRCDGNRCGHRFTNTHYNFNTFYNKSYLRYRRPYKAASYIKSAPAVSRKDYFYTRPWKVSEKPWHNHQQYRGGPEEGNVYEFWQDVPSWKLNRGYRERREIFDQLEAMGKYFRLDLRACIKRSMCELGTRFMEHHNGGLLMEDLLRIILTIPDEIGDEKYRHRADIADCSRFYAVSCPYRVLDFLTFSSRQNVQSE